MRRFCLCMFARGSFDTKKTAEHCLVIYLSSVNHCLTQQIGQIGQINGYVNKTSLFSTQLYRAEKFINYTEQH